MEKTFSHWTEMVVGLGHSNGCEVEHFDFLFGYNDFNLYIPLVCLS